MERRSPSYYKGEKYMPTVDELLEKVRAGASLEELMFEYSYQGNTIGKILGQKVEEYRAIKRFLNFEERLKKEPALVEKLNAFLAKAKQLKRIPHMGEVKNVVGYNKSTYNYFVDKAKAKGYELPVEEESEEDV